MTSATSGFLFREDQERERRRKKWEDRSRIYGTSEFWFAYHLYIRTPQWRKLCHEVKKRAHNRCERCGPHVIQVGGPYHVHHLTYDRFMNELLCDLQHLCVPCHRIADREREQRNQHAYEAAGEGAREAKGMNTYFTKKYGEDWGEQFGSDIANAYEEWWEWKRDRLDEGG
jgi:hypothetical protein